MTDINKLASQSNNNDKVKLSKMAKIASKRVIGIVIATAAVFIVAGFVLFNKPSTDKKINSALPVIEQKYEVYEKYTVQGSTSGSGMTFSKPKEFVGNGLSSKLSANFLQVSTSKNNETTPFGELAATATALSYPYPKNGLEAVNKSIMSATPSNTKPVESMLTFVSYYVDKGYTLKMTSVKQFKSSNIKANAWVVDITAAPTKAADADKLPPQTGRVLYALGQKGFYYFFAMTADYNWSSNQASWDKVFNSVAIDK